MLKHPLLIVGASVRPWVQSAMWAGIDFRAVDLFADWDTCQIACSANSLVNQPEGAEQKVRPGGWGTILRIESFENVFQHQSGVSMAIDECDYSIACGGIETRLEFVRRLELKTELLGPNSRQLQRLKDPVRVFAFLRSNGFQVPETQRSTENCEDTRNWLIKHAGSSGGSGVQPAGAEKTFPPGGYYQQSIEGDLRSACFVSFRNREGETSTQLLAVTRQLVGDKRFGAARFQYCGSIATDVASHDLNVMRMVGREIGKEYQLLGMWGIDFVTGTGGVFPVDINPRLTASMELLESLINSQTRFSSLLDLHLSACRGRLSEEELQNLPLKDAGKTNPLEGKAILFNHDKLSITISPNKACYLRSRYNAEFWRSLEEGFSFADIPHEGVTIQPHQPILTIRLRYRARVSERLSDLARQVYDTLNAPRNETSRPKFD